MIWIRSEGGVLPVCAVFASTALGSCFHLWVPTHTGYVFGTAGPGTDFADFITNAGNNNIVVVQLQYRLGHFGFLGRQETKDHGVLNAGLLDQVRACNPLQFLWPRSVRCHIRATH